MDDVMFRIGRDLRDEVESSVDVDAAWLDFHMHASTPPTPLAATPAPRRDWMLAAAVIAVLAIVGVTFAVRDRSGTVETSEPTVPAVTVTAAPPSSLLPSTSVAVAITDTSTVAATTSSPPPDSTAAQTTAPATLAPTSAPTTIPPSTTVRPTTTTSTSTTTTTPTTTTTLAPAPSPPWEGARQYNGDGSLGLAGLNDHITATLPTWAYDPQQLAEMVAGALNEGEQRSVEVDHPTYVVDTDHLDDSIATTRITVVVEQSGSQVYVVSSASWAQACRPGRGHQDFSPELCV